MHPFDGPEGMGLEAMDMGHKALAERLYFGAI